MLAQREQKEELLTLLDEKIKRLEVTASQASLIEFAKRLYPNYSVGGHHKIMAKLFKDVLDGKKKRIIINIAPRHGKSELTSYLLPAWWLGHALHVRREHYEGYPPTVPR